MSLAKTGLSPQSENPVAKVGSNKCPVVVVPLQCAHGALQASWIYLQWGTI